MKFLRNLLDKVEPLFTKGGKLERFYPLYEAGDTFLFTPGEVTKNGPHVRDSLDMKRMMSTVIVALGPCILMALYNTGYQANLQIDAGTALAIDDWREVVYSDWLGLKHDPSSILGCFVYGALWFLPVYAVTMAVGGTIELVFSLVRGHEINEGFLVTGMLYPLTLPPTTPLLVVAAGIAFGVFIGKEVFGGTGKNFLNPALTARAFVYFAFANYLSGETNPLGQGVWVAVQKSIKLDGFTGATTLAAMVNTETGNSPAEAMTEVTQGITGHAFTWWDPFIGFIQGSMGETSTLACLIGAAILIATGIGSWRIMTGCVLGALAIGGLTYGFAGENSVAYISPVWQLLIGGFAFGTVFMATDPVSAAMTETGKWWYGGLIGGMTVLIRVVNPAFPEGIMLAILFGNVMAPTIDYLVIQANIKRRLARYGT
ncbi:NADH:ubiquinone reductase (Na(+)-transporting) subunit B [Aeoliella sp. ICT_H6.2]|uniref:Na(+)-translocating NADH-quinone reductase subunit B n=1 Tax=Aeoliella straminimaris TaxID=2954799 RepID=A0A9X2FIK6_9BACT|nr:NADH:ubiquinone reductase (Na(+)-transporting) subunit B [Aeoliella straminimaris]MCO6047944.1 NADH:ubiquinone reductase (Na(+)-transporting) subunit B [Aeoliella straminimaris]